MITKEQLLAMPKEDYMNEEQLAFFKNLLLQQKEELNHSIEQARSNLAEQERNPDPNDVATQQEMQQVYLRTVERQSKLLNKINKTLQLIEEGDYGYCEITGDPIGLERLLARPTATMSVAAKEIQEHHERTEGS